MIKKLDFEDNEVLNTCFQIQRQAYEVEARLIGTRSIPPLQESLEQLKQAKESFWGFWQNEVPIGFVAIEDEGPDLRLSRLVVSPEFFARGVATRLIQYVLANLRNGRNVIVSTGKDNYPARRLYKKLGFIEKRTLMVTEIALVELMLGSEG